MLERFIQMGIFGKLNGGTVRRHKPRKPRYESSELNVKLRW